MLGITVCWNFLIGTPRQLDFVSHLDTNVKDGYECNEFDIVGFDCLSHQDTNVKDGYECYEFDIGWEYKC